jgi:hypothetical protein
LNIDTSKFTELDKGRKILVGFMAAAAITLFACIPPIRADNYVGQSAWGLSVGCITLIVCPIIFKMFDDCNPQLVKVSAILMFIMWATVAGVCTFDGPFITAGNGYFSCWGGFFASTLFLQHCMTREDEIV